MQKRDYRGSHNVFVCNVFWHSPRNGSSATCVEFRKQILQISSIFGFKTSFAQADLGWSILAILTWHKIGRDTHGQFDPRKCKIGHFLQVLWIKEQSLTCSFRLQLCMLLIIVCFDSYQYHSFCKYFNITLFWSLCQSLEPGLVFNKCEILGNNY